MSKLPIPDAQPGSAGNVTETAVVTVAMGLALAWTGWTATCWFRYHPHLPWRDLFLVLNQVIELTHAPPGLATLWQWFEPHYGTHRIAVLRFLQLLDTRLLDGQSHMFYGAAWLCLLTILVLYVRLAGRYFREARSVLFIAALASIWLFSPANLWNLVNAINVSWHLSLTGALLAFYLLVRRAQEPRLRDWCGAYALCTLAAFSNFAGVIAWLMLPLLAALIQPRAILPTLALSGICAWLYAGGMSSDAALASQWDMGTPEVIATIRAQAEVALAANTPLRILEKTLQFLGWPLTARAPRLAMGLGVASVAILAVFLASAMLSSLRSRNRLHPWFSFCLLAAGLCLGIALATQLGRLIQHPNHAHGPSYERYQTVVVIYWLSVSGLIMGQKTRTSLTTALLPALLLALAVVLQVPWGDYLREEVQSAEAAARLFDRGRLAHANGLRVPAGNRFTPEYVYSFDEYFAQRRLAYRAPQALPAGMNRVAPCEPGSVKILLGQATGFREYPRASAPRALEARLILPRGSWMTRAVALYQDEQLAGRLSPVHQGNYTPYALVDSTALRWQGIVAPSAWANLVLVLEGVTGDHPWCSVTLPDRT